MNNHRSIAFAIHCLGGGGAERVMSGLASYFAEHQYDVHLICNIKTDWEYPISPMIKRHFIGMQVSKIRLLAAFQRLVRFRRLCRKERFDLLVSFMSLAENSVFATFGLHTKNVISLRIYPSIQYPTSFKRFYAKTLLSAVDGAVFQTKEAQQWFSQKLQQKSTIIFNPIWNQFYSVDRCPEPNLIIATGRLTEQKNYPLMLKAICRVRKIRKVRLEIYGKGPAYDSINALIETIGLKDIVVLCGQSDNVQEVLRRADIYLLTSDYEGLPNALMEAMAVGVPCVATDSLGGGCRMLLGNSERGVLVPCGDDEAIANAILKLLDDEKYKKSLSNEARCYAERFSMDHCFKTWESYLTSFL